MKAIHRIQHGAAKKLTFTNALASCRKLLAQIEGTKAAILREFGASLEAHQHLLRLALNEAEALAWQSGVPQLVFPTLAREKAQAVVVWNARQRSLQQTRTALAV